MKIEIVHAETDEQIEATFDVVLQLRPHLERSNYVATIRSLMASDGLKVLTLLDQGEVRAVAVYRVMHMLYCESLVYIDDLVVDERTRSHGYGAQLISSIKDEGRALGCSEVQLISRVTREQAHRFYFREGFGMECFHFRTKLS